MQKNSDTEQIQRRIYQQPDVISVEDAEAAILRNDPEELYIVPISVSLYEDDFEWAQGVCLRLAEHPHFAVRANALLGFGHLARRFGRLDRSKVDPLIQKGLQDSEAAVRDQADSAADDVAHFLDSRVGKASASASPKGKRKRDHFGRR